MTNYAKDGRCAACQGYLQCGGCHSCGSRPITQDPSLVIGDEFSHRARVMIATIEKAGGTVYMTVFRNGRPIYEYMGEDRELKK